MLYGLRSKIGKHSHGFDAACNQDRVRGAFRAGLFYSGNVMTFGLSCWAMSEPTYERLGMAGFFAVAVFIPSLARERKRNGKDGETD